LGNGILQLAQDDEKQYVCLSMFTMETAPEGLVFLSINLGTLVSMTLTTFCSLGKESMEGIDVWIQLLLLLLLLLLASLPPPMDLGLLRRFVLAPPSPMSRPLPLLAIDRANDIKDEDEADEIDDVAGAKPEAAGAQRRKKNAAR